MSFSPNGNGSAPVVGTKLKSTRVQSISSMTEAPLDLLVVGGGIVGSGIVRDAALRGLRVGLVEQHDFAFGTSSRSSRLLHGGMRYLAQGRLKLVREASVEKKIIHQIAPHLAAPLPFIFPAYEGDRDWALWQLKIGVKIYDLLCGGRNFGKSTWQNAGETIELASLLKAEGLKGSVRYFDGFTNDARLVLDTLRSAARKGGMVLNYCRFNQASKRELWECELEDRLTQINVKLSARAVVNATGPWAGGLPHSRVKLRLTKGVHVVVQRSRLPVPATIVMTDGKRIMFAIPWGERTIIGTTDTDYDGPLDQVLAEEREIRYLFEVANRFFPRAQLTQTDVISTWAGLRPLIADANEKPSDISRSHQIRTPEPGWWDVAGGKLTTYRLMAEETVDAVVQKLIGSKTLNREISSCRTAEELLLPESETDGVSGILPPECSRRAVEHFCNKEWAIHLDDVMLRRTSWHYYYPETHRLAERVADWMGEYLDWSGEVRAEELKRYERATGARSVSQKVQEPAAA